MNLRLDLCLRILSSIDKNADIKINRFKIEYILTILL